MLLLSSTSAPQHPVFTRTLPYHSLPYSTKLSFNSAPQTISNYYTPHHTTHHSTHHATHTLETASHHTIHPTPHHTHHPLPLGVLLMKGDKDDSARKCFSALQLIEANPVIWASLGCIFERMDPGSDSGGMRVQNLLLLLFL